MDFFFPLMSLINDFKQIKISICRLANQTLTFFSQSGTVLSELERLRSRLDAVACDEVLPELLPDSMEIYSAWSSSYKTKNVYPVICRKVFINAKWKILFVHQVLARVADVIQPPLITSAKQPRAPCSGPPKDSMNYLKCILNFLSSWLANPQGLSRCAKTYVRFSGTGGNLVRTCKPLKWLVCGTGTFLIRKNTQTVEKNWLQVTVELKFTLQS